MLRKLTVPLPSFAATVQFVPRGYAIDVPAGDQMVQKYEETQGRDFYEQGFLDIVKDMGMAGLYLEVGAHIGNHAVWWLRECSAEAVACVEMAADIWPVLTANVLRHAEDKDVYLAQAAVGIADAAWASTGPADRNSGGRKAGNASRWGSAWAVPAITIDGLVDGLRQLGETRPVTLMKLDVEGAEVGALRGATGVLSEWHPVVVAETAGAYKDGRSVPGTREAQVAQIAEILRGYGYSRAPMRVPTPTPTWLWEADGQ